MKIICVDDEADVLQQNVRLCSMLPQAEEVGGFTSPERVLEWMKEHQVDLAFLDIEMPEMNGLTLAAKIREENPNTGIVFLTKSSRYAVDAFAIHADGYLLKPATQEQLCREAEYVASRRQQKRPVHVFVQTFGSFDVLVDGKVVAYRRSKAKELLAYLVDRQGSSISRPEAFSILYGDAEYSHAMQKQLDVMIRSLRDTLREYGIEEILEMKRGVLRICPEKIECDLYRFLKGDRETIDAYRGVYMSPYAWAAMTQAYITRKKEQPESE